MNKYAIIVAGGTGTRMKGDMPKQFMLINGQAAIIYSIKAFAEYDAQMPIIIAIHPDYIRTWTALSNSSQVKNPIVICEGGETRYNSVKNALQFIDNPGLIAIHDAARPLIDSKLIKTLFDTAQIKGSAIPCIPITDTVRMINENTSKLIDRNLLRSIQTPQVFRSQELKQAYSLPFSTSFTDDASVLEKAGYNIHLTEGNSNNIKITYPTDIQIAELFLNQKTKQSY